MLRHLQLNRAFFIPFFASLILSLILWLYLGHGFAVQWMDNTVGPNKFMGFLTVFGEWIGGVILFILLGLFAKRKSLLIFIMSIAISSGTAQLLKRGVFEKEKRPSFFYNLEESQNVERHVHYSFPSGHTTAAFTMFGCFAFAFASAWIKGLSFVLAASVGISRMALGQHFLVDVTVGAVLGTIICAMVWVLLSKILKSPKWKKKIFSS